MLSSLEPSERFTELHREKRGRKEIEVSRRRQGGFKRREIELGSTLFPKCSPQPRIPTEIHRIGLKRDGGGRR